LISGFIDVQHKFSLIDETKNTIAGMNMDMNNSIPMTTELHHTPAKVTFTVALS